METQINKTLLNKLLENKKILQMNMMEVVNYIYDSTYLTYSMKFHEEKNKREEYEKRIVKKNMEIDRLTLKLKEMEEKYEEVSDSE